MAEDPLHERMEHHDGLASEAAETARERETVARAVSQQIAASITEAVAVEGATVETVSEPTAASHRFQFNARLDGAGLIAAISERLPAGFYISHLNADGTISIDWNGDGQTPVGRQHGAILKAIIAEETVTDADGLIEAVPTVETVIERAIGFGIAEDDAVDRLGRLATLDVVDITADGVYPDTNFGMY
jgi:hypothetical protein